MTDVALKEYLEAKIHAIEKRIEDRLDYRDKELVRQAREYELHFDKLNHEQARLQSDRDHFVSKEVFEPWRDLVNNNLSMSRGAADTGKLILSTVVPAIVAVTVVVISKLF